MCEQHSSRSRVLSLLFLVVLFGVLTLLSFLTGCGHNQCVYLDGTELDLGVMKWRNGKILTINCREQVECNVDNRMNTESENKSEVVSKIVFKVQDQKNGYNTK